MVTLSQSFHTFFRVPSFNDDESSEKYWDLCAVDDFPSYCAGWVKRAFVANLCPREPRSATSVETLLFVRYPSTNAESMECVKGSVSSALRVHLFALAHVESYLWEVDKILSLDCDSNRVRIFSDCLRERLGISAHKRPVKECGLTQLTARCQTFRGWICWRYLIEPAWNDVHQVVAKQDARTIPCFVGEATISSTSSKWSASSLYTWGWWMTFLPSHFEETHAMGCFALCIHLISHRPLLDETSGFSWYLHQPHWPTSTEYSLLSSAAHHEFLTEQFLCSSLLSRSHDSHIYTF